MLLAPDAPERMVKITSHDADLMLFDGRILAQNGWFVVRSLLPAGKTGKVLTGRWNPMPWRAGCGNPTSVHRWDTSLTNLKYR